MSNSLICSPIIFLLDEVKLIVFLNKLMHMEIYQQPYHWMLSTGYRELYNLRSEIVLELAKEGMCYRWLDIGCGDGKFTSSIKGIAKVVVGIDISEPGLLFARCLVPEVKFCLMDSSKMAFPDSTFDVVSCLDVLEHLSQQKLEKTLNEMHRVLKDDGALIISVPSKNKPLESKHYRHFDSKEISNVMKPLFTPVKLVGCGKYYPLIKYLFNMPKICKIAIGLVVKKCHPDDSFTIVAKLAKNKLR